MNVVSSGGIPAHPAGEGAGRDRLHPTNVDPPGTNHHNSGSLSTPRSLRSARESEATLRALAPALALALAHSGTPRPYPTERRACGLTGLADRAHLSFMGRGSATQPAGLGPAEARLLEEFGAGKRPALARAISIVENGRPAAQALLNALHARLGRARRIGITGPPGAGKSTLVAALVAALRARGETVGVVAVDPTSPFTGGALLGDRIRMGEVTLDPGVFIRSMATRGSLGGLALATKEVADVLDAFGFDHVLVETVGVGQSELDIAAAADTTIVVLVPESGDSIQAMKAGLMEIADLFVINKADRPGAERLAREVEMMLHLRA